MKFRNLHIKYYLGLINSYNKQLKIIKERKRKITAKLKEKLAEPTN
jgi:hypothetical protein